MVPVERGAVLLYSEQSGTYARHLDPDGRAHGPALLLGPPCRGGLEGTVHAGGVIVACSRPADPDRDRPGEVLLGRLEESGWRTIDRVAGVGAASRGVELASDGARLVLAWHDADGLSSRARVAELVGEQLGEPRQLSSQPMQASAPSIVLHEGALWSAWTESWLGPARRSEGQLFVQREGEPPVPSLELNELRAPVRLGADGGGLFLALRDRRPRAAEHERSVVGRLDSRLRLARGALRSPAKADDPSAEPRLVPCDGHVFSVTTRRSRRQVTLVSLRRLDAELRPAEAEHQIYEYHARFPRVAAACVDERLLVAVGEQQSHVSPVPRLRTYALRCGTDVPHARTPGIEGQVLRKR